MENKKKLQVIFSFIIGILFISSYAVFSNLNNTANTSSNANVTSSNQAAKGQTIFLTTTSNALIENYTGTASILYICKNQSAYNSTTSILTSKLTDLENNGSVSTFYQSQKQLIIDLGSYSPTALYSYLLKQINETEISCLSLNATAELLVPSYVNFTISSSTSKNSTQKIPIAMPKTARSIYLNVTIPSNSFFVPILIHALVYQNGTVYQLEITRNN